MALINNQIIRNIRLVALDNIQSNSIEWYVEQAMRYYSKTYITPLAEVRKMNPIEVLQIFLEDEAKDIPPEELQELHKKILNSPQPLLDLEQYERPEEDEGLDDDAWVAQQIAEAERREKQAKKQPANKVSSSGPSMADAAMQAHKAIEGLYKQLNKPLPTGDDEIKFESED